MSIPKNFAALGTPLRNGGGRGWKDCVVITAPPPPTTGAAAAAAPPPSQLATCTRAVKEMLGEKRRKSSKLRQLISSQTGSIRNFFGTAKNLRHRTTGANQPQQQQVEAVAK
ncbi:hypothetical protein niasHS_011401 [Heterodera schachtii]|uniref:Uncharacterized protein n=1 Tax=Heterodera schachtii TaxID=97005 RepID=A0ABD2ITP1_HETSC